MDDGVALMSTAHPRPYWTYKPTRDGRSPYRRPAISESALEMVEIEIRPGSELFPAKRRC